MRYDYNFLQKKMNVILSIFFAFPFGFVLGFIVALIAFIGGVRK